MIGGVRFEQEEKNSKKKLIYDKGEKIFKVNFLGHNFDLTFKMTCSDETGLYRLLSGDAFMSNK